jgi:hypothetical protein
VPARHPQPLNGGLGSGKPNATRRQWALERGEKGGDASVGHGGVVGIRDGSLGGATTSAKVALENLLTPEPEAKEDAPVGAETKASASPSHTCTRRASVGRASDGGIWIGTPVPTSMTTGVGDGRCG